MPASSPTFARTVSITKTPTSVRTDVDVAAWQTRVTAAGGMLTAAQVAAYAEYVKYAKALGWYHKIKRENWFIGENLTTALVPQKVSIGFNAELNYNFVAGDFTPTGGLVSNGSTKYLNTGARFGNLVLANKNSMLAFWSATKPTTNTYFMGSYSTNPFALWYDTYGTGWWSSYAYDFDNDAGAVSYDAATTASNVLLMGVYDRVESRHVIRVNADEYQATNATTGSINKLPMFIFCTNVDGTPTDYMACTSFGYAIGYGLVYEERVQFYELVKAMQTALGRTV